MATMAEALRVARGREMAQARDRESTAKNVLLFFAAPWIGLAYIIALPFVGWLALAKLALARR